MTKIIDAEYVVTGSRTLSADELEGVTARAGEARARLDSGSLKGMREDVWDLFGLLRDFLTDAYRRIPYRCVLAIGFALAYLLNPLSDLVPDALPVIGLVDDAVVIAVCLRLIGPDLERYRAWRAIRRS